MRATKKFTDLKGHLSRSGFRNFTPDKQHKIYDEIIFMIKGNFLRELETHKIDSDNAFSGKENKYLRDRNGFFFLIFAIGVTSFATIAYNGFSLSSASNSTNSTAPSSTNDSPKSILIFLAAILAAVFAATTNALTPIKSYFEKEEEKGINDQKRETHLVQECRYLVKDFSCP